MVVEINPNAKRCCECKNCTMEHVKRVGRGFLGIGKERTELEGDYPRCNVVIETKENDGTVRRKFIDAFRYNGAQNCAFYKKGVPVKTQIILPYAYFSTIPFGM